MPTHEVRGVVAAPIQRVWDATIDILAWPGWLPTVTEVSRLDDGPLQPGSVVVLRQPKLRPARWTVETVDPGSDFTWTCRGPGYSITAQHLLSPVATGTDLRLRLSRAGPLAPLLWAMAGRRSRTYLDQELAAVTRRCELPPPAD